MLHPSFNFPLFAVHAGKRFVIRAAWMAVYGRPNGYRGSLTGDLLAVSCAAASGIVFG